MSRTTDWTEDDIRDIVDERIAEHLRRDPHATDNWINARIRTVVDERIAKHERRSRTCRRNGYPGVAPCQCCGYNGKGYHQPLTHPCAAKPTPPHAEDDIREIVDDEFRKRQAWILDSARKIAEDCIAEHERSKPYPRRSGVCEHVGGFTSLRGGIGVCVDCRRSVLLEPAPTIAVNPPRKSD